MRNDFFFRLSVVLGIVVVVFLIAIITGCCSSSSVEISKEVLCL